MWKPFKKPYVMHLLHLKVFSPYNIYSRTNVNKLQNKLTKGSQGDHKFLRCSQNLTARAISLRDLTGFHYSSKMLILE